jgi:hypothetical protein
LKAQRGPTFSIRSPTAVRRCSGGARPILAALAAGYLFLIALGLPVAKTREALDTGLLAAPAPADDVDRVGRGYPPGGNPDDDFSDAIPVSSLVVFACPIPGLDLPRPTPGALVGETDAPRLKVFSTREDFERGPPSLT